jgi:hypothetical protein
MGAGRRREDVSRLQWLFRVVFSDAGGGGIDTALLADVEDPVVSAALERVATKRLSYIEAQYKLMGVKAASDRAVLTYTAFVGLAQLRRSTPSLAPRDEAQRSTSPTSGNCSSTERGREFLALLVDA